MPEPPAQALKQDTRVAAPVGLCRSFRTDAISRRPLVISPQSAGDYYGTIRPRSAARIRASARIFLA
jgi:hypothetical protein